MSCSVTPTLTTRVGCSGTTVSPNLCATVAGKAPSPSADAVVDWPDSGSSSLPHAASGQGQQGDGQGRAQTHRRRTFLR